MIMKAISGFFGAIAGAVTGCLSGMILSFGYYAGKAEVWPEMALVFGLGIPGGGLLGLFRGAYIGATEGFLAGVKSPAKLYAHYFGVKRNNEQLDNYVEQLDSQAMHNSVLSESEIRKFEKYLELMRDEVSKNRLKEELKEYKSYMNQECPISHKKVWEHGRPITMRVVDENGCETHKIYDREIILAGMKFSSEPNAIGLEIPSKNLPFEKDDIVSTRFLDRISAFINEVRRKLALLFSTRATLRTLQSELGDSAGNTATNDRNHQKPFSPISQPLYELINSVENDDKEEQTDDSSHSNRSDVSYAALK